MPRHCARTAALLHLLLRLLRLRLWASGLRGAECLRCTVWSVSLPFFFPTARPLPLLWVSSTLSSSRACSAALLAALSTRIHQAFFHHVMCLFDSSLSSCNEFAPFFTSTHPSYVIISSSPSRPFWANHTHLTIGPVSFSCHPLSNFRISFLLFIALLLTFRHLSLFWIRHGLEM